MFDKIYCAPMEGVTRSVFRREHHTLFGGCDQYVTPFLAPSADGIFSEPYFAVTTFAALGKQGAGT